jgi:hypothetical protein
MAVAFIIQFSGIGSDMYDKVQTELGLASPGVTGVADDWPDGIISHTAGTTPDGWCVVDVWESQAKFDEFMQTRLGPALGKAGMPEPQVTTVEVYNRHG